ncbi:hypothetical protein EXS45_01575 [Candidatus Nomurabacteria bacterium]|nr:hypothetical protein [Candidatus Nomurabacteria bacterium]
MKNFEESIKAAKDQLTLHHYDSKPELVYALSGFAKNPAYRAKIVDYIKTGFDQLREETKKRAEKNKYDHLINQIMFGALGRLAAMIGENSLSPLIYKEFIFAGDNDQFFELNVETGTLAIALSILGYTGDLTEFKKVLDHWESVYEDRQKFVTEMYYALWILKQDKSGPMVYLKDSKHKTNLSYVAAALADLDVKSALAVLNEKIIQIKNPVTKEVFLEAVTRLGNQKINPIADERMIWMFGKLSSTEIALGNESDNEFIRRAMEKTKNMELGIVYEVDDSSKEDL